MSNKEEIESVTKLKDTDSFAFWEMDINILLEAKRLKNIVDKVETLETCKDEVEETKWKTNDALAKHIILRTVDPIVKTHLLTCQTAHDMYSTICKTYKSDTQQTKNRLLSEFLNYRYNKDLDVLGNIAGIQTLSYKLNSLGTKVDDEMMMTKMFLIFPDQYKHFSVAWDSTPSS